MKCTLFPMSQTLSSDVNKKSVCFCERASLLNHLSPKLTTKPKPKEKNNPFFFPSDKYLGIALRFVLWSRGQQSQIAGQKGKVNSGLIDFLQEWLSTRTGSIIQNAPKVCCFCSCAQSLRCTFSVEKRQGKKTKQK